MATSESAPPTRTMKRSSRFTQAFYVPRSSRLAFPLYSPLSSRTPPQTTSPVIYMRRIEPTGDTGTTTHLDSSYSRRPYTFVRFTPPSASTTAVSGIVTATTDTLLDSTDTAAAVTIFSTASEPISLTAPTDTTTSGTSTAGPLPPVFHEPKFSDEGKEVRVLPNVIESPLTYHGRRRPVNDPTSTDTPIFDSVNNQPATVPILFSVGTILVIVASVGAFGIRRSQRRLLPKSAEKCKDNVDRFIALESTPAWVAAIARNVDVPFGFTAHDAALARALGVPVQDIAHLREQAHARKLEQQPFSEKSLPEDPSEYLRSLFPYRSTRQGVSSSVKPVWARDGPSPPEFSVDEVIQLRRRMSYNGNFSAWDAPHTTLRRRSVIQETPVLPQTRHAMRVGSYCGSVDTQMSESYDPNRRARFTFSSLSRPQSTNVVKVGQSMGFIVTAYSGPLRLASSQANSINTDLLPSGRQRAHSLPSGLLRYFAYMAVLRHTSKDTEPKMSRIMSTCSDNTIMSMDENVAPIYDAEGNVIVAPIYQLPGQGRMHWFNPAMSRNSSFSDAMTEQSVRPTRAPAAMRLSYSRMNSFSDPNIANPVSVYDKKSDESDSENHSHEPYPGRSTGTSSLRRRRSSLVPPPAFMSAALNPVVQSALNNRLSTLKSSSTPDPSSSAPRSVPTTSFVSLDTDKIYDV